MVHGAERRSICLANGYVLLAELEKKDEVCEKPVD